MFLGSKLSAQETYNLTWCFLGRKLTAKESHLKLDMMVSGTQIERPRILLITRRDGFERPRISLITRHVGFGEANWEEKTTQYRFKITMPEIIDLWRRPGASWGGPRGRDVHSDATRRAPGWSKNPPWGALGSPVPKRLKYTLELSHASGHGPAIVFNLLECCFQNQSLT